MRKGIIINIIFILAVFTLFTNISALVNYCEGNFDGDLDVDGTDAFVFKQEFGRSKINNPCTNDAPCKADFDCDGDVDGSDAFVFKSDFGRSGIRNPCPFYNLSLNKCSYGGSSFSLSTTKEEYNIGEQILLYGIYETLKFKSSSNTLIISSLEK